MKLKAKKISILLILGFALFISTINSNNYSNWQKNTVNNPKSSDGYNLSFIHIDGSISGNWTATFAEDWCKYESGFYVIENVTIDASNSPTGNGILINNSLDVNFIIRNCTIIPDEGGSGGLDDYVGGIKLENCSRGILYNNTCSNGDDYAAGIFLYNEVNNITIERNKVQMNTGWGILVGSSSYNITIRNNTVTQNYQRGIYLIDDVYNTTIINNNVNDNLYSDSIYLTLNCDNNKIINNNGTITGVFYSQDHGIHLENGCDYNFIFNNTVNNNHERGIYINNNCNNNSVLNNTICNSNEGKNQDRGIFLNSNSNDNNITGNIINNNEDFGIYLSNCHNNILTGNTVNFNTQHGLCIYNSKWNNITENNVNYNTYIGIYLFSLSNNNSIKNNTINRNDAGIVLDDSNYNNITENILNDNNWCIFETDSTGNNITNNDCSIPTVQAPIFIDGTATGVGAHNWSWVEDQEWFGGGLGTEEVPYIIENLIISGFGAYNQDGIKIQNSNVSFIIQGCVIYNCSSGIYLENVNNSLLINNNCSNNTDFGIILYSNCYFNNIINNTCNDNDIGIKLSFSNYNNMTGNTATGNSNNGIYMDNSNDYNIIMGNIFSENRQGIEVYDESDFNKIIGNIASNNEYDGLIIENSFKNLVQGNNLSTNLEYGIILKESSKNNTILENIVIDNNKDGIVLESNCINNTISENTLNNNYRGIYLFNNAEENIISENTMNYNVYGITISSNCHNNTISANKINGIYDGIEMVTACEDNTILGNTIRNCTQGGIALSEGCDSNEFMDNIIYNNSLGIDTGDCDDNLFYRNFFVNNTKHAIDGGTDNKWNSSTIGNYWDNHTEPDDNPPYGIVDDPYTYIGGSTGSIDYLPIADDDLPTITINSPTSGNIFGSMAPSFNVRITDVYLYEMWYTIDGGLNNFTFTDNGTINQDAWDAAADGSVTLTFFGRDKPWNINSDEVVIVKDYETPIININAPSSGEVFDNNAPSFNVRITDDYLVSMWYTIDGGLNNYTFTTNSTVNQTRWGAMSDGAITLRFYAIDDLGHLGSAEVSIIKDTVAPVITINSPTEGETFGKTAPSFIISIIEANLDEIWYSYDGGLTNYTIINNGTLDQTAWTALSEGEVNITFYARDLAGHESSESVNVIKSTPSGVDPGVIIIIVVVSFALGGIVVIGVAYILMKKRAGP